MARTLPTEESLGLSPTDDELATSTGLPDDIGAGDDTADDVADTSAVSAAPDQAETDADKPAERPDEQGKVDVRALQEARSEAREAKQRAASSEQRAAILEQRWNDFLAGSSQPKAVEKDAAPVVPKYIEDPIAAGQWTQDQILAMQQRQQEEQQQREATAREEQEWQQTFARVNTEFTTAAQADPTLPQAYDRLRESMGKELLAFGMSIPEAKAELDRIERQHIQFAAQKNIPIAQYIKTLAEARGWTPAAAAPAVPEKPKLDAAALAGAQQRHQSLSDASGGETVAPLDAKALARMSDKDFKAWMAKKGNEAKFDEIMGG